jgi:hypothetical protein
LVERSIPWSITLPFTQWINLRNWDENEKLRKPLTQNCNTTLHMGRHGVHMGGDIFVKDYNWKVRVLLMDLPVDHCCKWINGLQEVKKLELEKVWVEKMAFWS